MFSISSIVEIVMIIYVNNLFSWLLKNTCIFIERTKEIKRNKEDSGIPLERRHQYFRVLPLSFFFVLYFILICKVQFFIIHLTFT